MGSALLRGVLQKGLYQPDEIEVAEPVPALQAALASEFGVAVNALKRTGPWSHELALVCLKPQVFGSAMQGFREHRLVDIGLYVSIMAGVSLHSLQLAAGTGNVVRAMPNTPAQVLAGMTVWTATSGVSRAQRESARAIFAAVGEELYTDYEEDLDRAAAINGSGPGYLFLVLEAMIDAGVHIGLSRDAAAKLATQTLLGSGELAKQMADIHPAELRNRVTSPGGTTAAGIQELELAGLRGTFTSAIESAWKRSVELGG
jgi:pyrroline-5-carboxylate reductase